MEIKFFQEIKLVINPKLTKTRPEVDKTRTKSPK